MAELDDLTGPVPPVRLLGVPRRYLAQGKPDRILADLGLDGTGIAAAVVRARAVEQERAGSR
jgi:deoxyxylulose-5-phosphate synthase